MSGTLAVDACQESHPAKAEVRILLADDHALLRRGLREFLRDFLVEDGLTPDIVETASARHAIDHIRTGTWDLVIHMDERCPADFNKSGALEIADVFDFLNAWFAGCP